MNFGLSNRLKPKSYATSAGNNSLPVQHDRLSLQSPISVTLCPLINNFFYSIIELEENNKYIGTFSFTYVNVVSKFQLPQLSSMEETACKNVLINFQAIFGQSQMASIYTTFKTYDRD